MGEITSEGDVPKYNKGLHLQKVNGLTTVFDVDPKDIRYKDFLKIREHWRSSGPLKYRNNQLGIATVEQFYEFIEGYIKEIGLFAKSGGPSAPHGIYIREGGNLDTYCEPLPIFSRKPEGGSYEPILTFTTNQKQLSATANLRRRGDWRLEVLEEILIGRKGEEVKAAGDGTNKPIITYDLESGIRVSSIRQVKRVIEAMAKLYQQVGDQKLHAMLDFKRDLERAQSPRAREMLSAEYTNMRSAILPANLFP